MPGVPAALEEAESLDAVVAAEVAARHSAPAPAKPIA
jgi:hypothetical protein